MLIVGAVFALAALWSQWDLRQVWLLPPGATLGVALGTYWVSSVPGHAFRVTLGVIVLAFVAFFVIGPRLPEGRSYEGRRWHGAAGRNRRRLDLRPGALGRTPVTMYLLLPRLHPVRFVATTVLVFIILNLIKVPGVRGGGSLRLGTGVATVVGGAGHPGGRAAGRWRSRGSASAYSTG